MALAPLPQLRGEGEKGRDGAGVGSRDFDGHICRPLVDRHHPSGCLIFTLPRLRPPRAVRVLTRVPRRVERQSPSLRQRRLGLGPCGVEGVGDGKIGSRQGNPRVGMRVDRAAPRRHVLGSPGAVRGVAPTATAPDPSLFGASSSAIPGRPFGNLIDQTPPVVHSSLQTRCPGPRLWRGTGHGTTAPQQPSPTFYPPGGA